eukprot:6480129-Amphidinium_carterae.1
MNRGIANSTENGAHGFRSAPRNARYKLAPSTTSQESCDRAPHEEVPEGVVLCSVNEYSGPGCILVKMTTRRKRAVPLRATEFTAIPRKLFRTASVFCRGN